jgi:hypothetical protein
VDQYCSTWAHFKALFVRYIFNIFGIYDKCTTIDAEIKIPKFRIVAAKIRLLIDVVSPDWVE